MGKKIVRWWKSVVEVVTGWFKPKKLAYFRLTLEDGTMQRMMTIDQKATINLTGVDRQDNVAPVVGVPIWTTSNPAVGTLTVAADGLSAEFKAATMGVTQVTAALGSVRSKDPVDFTTEAGSLFAFVLTVGPNEAQ